MALKPTIYKFQVSISDLDRNYFDTINLTIAQHPSESVQRMMARVVAYIFNADTQLKFTKGLSSADEPDIEIRELDGQQKLWIDVGEPAFDRIKKASRASKQVKIYSFNSKSDVWWSQVQSKFSALDVYVAQLPTQAINDLAQTVQRTMDFTVTLSEGSGFFSTQLGDVEVALEQLQ